ncbi:hypothetical protein ABEB36_007387 [Hypothenemus hampei]|uniref:Odorant receptor n=1 Tax=Hypothenemus hampei TaxID=57062 RepID=A0ABD1EUQ1_HYPHA
MSRNKIAAAFVVLVNLKRRRDFLWFLHKKKKSYLDNNTYFFLTWTLTIYCIVEVSCQLILLTEKPSTDQIISFAPIFFVSLQTLSGISSLMLQRTAYDIIYEECTSIWKRERANGAVLEEVRQLFNYSIILIFTLVIIGIVSPFGFINYNGDPEATLLPVSRAMALLEGYPKWLIIIINIITYVMAFLKSDILVTTCFHFVHVAFLFCISNIMFRSYLGEIQCPDNELILIDDLEYQLRVTQILKYCINKEEKEKKQQQTQFTNTSKYEGNKVCMPMPASNLTTKRIKILILKYFDFRLLLQLFNGVLTITFLAYITVFMKGGNSPMGVTGASVGAFVIIANYGHHSQIFYEQVSFRYK